MKKTLTTTLALALVLAMSAVSFAGPGYGRGGCNGQGKGMYSQLTPEKQAEVDTIFKKYDSQFDELRTQLWTKHSVLQAMLNNGDSNEKKIGKVPADITVLGNQMRDLRESMNKEISAATGIEVASLRGQGCGRGKGQGYGRNGNCPGSGPCGQGTGQGRLN